MNFLKFFERALGIGLFMLLLQPIQAQYTMDELAFGLGGGLAILPNGANALSGPGLNLNASYAHYLCGKAYGFHFTAGANTFSPATQMGEPFLKAQLAGKTRFLLAGAELGGFFKVRIHDYHRSREVALLIGPKINFPVLASYHSEIDQGSLRNNTDKVNPFQVGAHISLQFRRPAPEKKSWFIEPGIDYYFSPTWTNDPAGHINTAYLFLNFGYAFWDKRG
ncbi:MAG TPA: hypothetical protein ENJ82_12680 [Bacteroidetes bacterium]|nr:hypothetical protein [Bacteroidota bacterium]